MEGKQMLLQNRIEISDFGLAYLAQLSAPLTHTQSASLLQKQKQGPTISSSDVKRRGCRIDFCTFSNQTQNIIKQKCRLFRVLGGDGSINESHHKMQVHYQNWTNEQNMIRHRVSDVQSMLTQNKFSEYDWHGSRQALRLKRKEILGEWELAQHRRDRNLKRTIGHRGRSVLSPN